jgi:predicted chitinase
MSSILTKDQLKQMVKNPYINQWYEALDQLLDDYEINTPLRVAHFVAQCAHESGNFVFIKENLNYKAASLQKTFPKYFPTAELAAHSMPTGLSGLPTESMPIAWATATKRQAMAGVIAVVA